MIVIGMSIGMEVGAALTKNIVLAIGQQLLGRLAAGSAGRLFPILGGFIGAGTNYIFIKGIGKSLQSLDYKGILSRFQGDD